MTIDEGMEYGDPEPITDELDRLVCATIDYSLDILGEVGELSPSLAIEDEKGARALLSFDEEEVEESLDKARQTVVDASKGKGSVEGLSAPVERYALAYDGVVEEFEGQGYEPALIIEYGERGLSSGYSAYMLYKNAGDPQEFMWTDPAAAGEGELLV